MSSNALGSFDVSIDRGFLPEHDPLRSLPRDYHAWDDVAADLPKLLMTDQLRSTVDAMPKVDSLLLQGKAELERAMMVLSYIGHAYVWTGDPTGRVPANLAIPWYEVSRQLGRPPILSYASYALHNWRRIDTNRPVELGNIALLQNFWGGADEEWFILVHIDIEHRAAAAMRELPNVGEYVKTADVVGLTGCLHTIAAAMEGMYATLCRMPEWCDPYIYYRRVRPYIHGWKNNPALPDGLTYEGVSAYSAGQHFRGETGAQSTIIPCIDAILGVKHEPGMLNEYLMEMRTYMPPAHRKFIEHLEAQPSARNLLPVGPTSLTEAYNLVLDWQEKFRAKHYEYAATYIHKQGQTDAANPTSVGTGGTPFMPYLKKHLDETGEHRVTQ